MLGDNSLLEIRTVPELQFIKKIDGLGGVGLDISIGQRVAAY